MSGPRFIKLGCKGEERDLTYLAAPFIGLDLARFHQMEKEWNSFRVFRDGSSCRIKRVPPKLRWRRIFSGRQGR